MAFSFLNKQSFYAQVRDYDPQIEPWLRAEYRNLSDAEEAFHNYQLRRKKPSLLSRIKQALTFDTFKMDVTFSSIHDYLSHQLASQLIKYLCLLLSIDISF